MASEKNRQRRLKKYFEEREKGLDHQKLKKRAAELRRAEEKRAGARRRKVRRGDWEDLVEGDARAFEDEQPRASSTQAWLARLEAERAAQEAGALGDGSPDANASPASSGLLPGAPDDAGAELAAGTVTFVTAGACRVALDVLPAGGSEALDRPASRSPDTTSPREDAEAELRCRVDGALRLVQRTALAVGDRVHVELEPDPCVRRVLPRVTTLSRPDPHDARLERVIAANVELVLVVAALREPRLSVGLVERVLLAVRRGGAAPLVVATKLDLCADPAAALAPLEPVRGTGVDVVACSARTGAGVAELRARVAGKLCVLVGHSGVGKSSLLNALDPGLGLREGRVRTADGKGRHTTTASSLHGLAGGARLIDTPGVRQFGLGPPTADELAEAFPEVAAAAAGCRFRDCVHEREPGCAVRAAVDSGAIPASRWRSWQRIRG